MDMPTEPKLQPSVWHEGEKLVQARAGVRAQAEELTGMYRHAVEPGMVGFLAQQPFAVLSTTDASGRVWASAVIGARGMIEVPDPTTIVLARSKIETQLPLSDIAAHTQIGMIAIDLTRRIRVRINGNANVDANGSVRIAIRQLYGNCSQYIQRRTVTEEAAPEPQHEETSETDSLSDSQAQMISRADTFYLASAHPAHGADASHRGGAPGFVRVVSETRLSFPDYAGNNMFNTLGNIAVNPAVGLLFVDFESGTTLQITGRASVDWDESRAAEFVGAKRVIDVEVQGVRETKSATSLRYRFESYSPFIPGL